LELMLRAMGNSVKVLLARISRDGGTRGWSRWLSFRKIRKLCIGTEEEKSGKVAIYLHEIVSRLHFISSFDR
jgi:hypothetical protein